jgi:hypothetical protein
LTISNTSSALQPLRPCVRGNIHCEGILPLSSSQRSSHSPDRQTPWFKQQMKLRSSAASQRNNECASALGQTALSAAWIVTIGATALFQAFSTNQCLRDGRAGEPAARVRWLVAGSAAIAIALGVTQWRDSQVQTACF